MIRQLIIAMLLLLPCVLAEPIYSESFYDISSGNVHVKHNILTEPFVDELEFFSEGMHNIEVSQIGVPIVYEETGSGIIIHLVPRPDYSLITIEYESNSLLERQENNWLFQPDYLRAKDNYIKIVFPAQHTVRGQGVFSSEKGRLVVENYLKDPQDVAYAFFPTTEVRQHHALGWKFIIAPLLALLLFYLIVRVQKSRSDVLSFLTDHQRLIMDALQKAGGRTTQAKLRVLTGLPKSSLSRNIRYLQNKGFLEKSSVGNSNLLVLKK